MRFLFVMDPAATMLPDRDTSFALMRGAIARGHQCLHCMPVDLSHQGREVTARCRPIHVANAMPPVTLGEAERVDVGALDAVFVRKDPPFDVAYLHLTQMLDLVGDRVLTINSPAGLRDANEKLFAFHFSHLMPRSLVSAEPELILEFLVAVGGRAVLKPIDGAGGRGVVILTLGDQNTRSLVDLHTAEGQHHALVQEYLPEVRGGDKRVILLDGAPLGAILRIPRDDDLRANIHAGGRVVPTELDAREAALVSEVGATLRARGLWFVGLDLIGGRLIEINVTSPTGLQELGRHHKRWFEQDVIAWVERRLTR
ncbi:MAG TPA: glutathione synthase [Polyangiaceae bacterium]|mgnify:FL=1|nr:glutathione synthase [Polyangiaceae bacterium]